MWCKIIENSQKKKVFLKITSSDPLQSNYKNYTGVHLFLLTSLILPTVFRQ